MSAGEFREWMAMDSLEPIGRERNDHATAILTWLVASVLGGKNAAGDVSKWLPEWASPIEDAPQTGDEMAAAMRERLRKLDARETERTT